MAGREYLAEFLGTFVLVLGGVGSAVLAGSQIGILGVSIAFGIGLLAMVYAIGNISGCHINPAVTIGIALSRGMKFKDVVGYIVAQLIGATVAAGIIFLIADGAPGGYNLAQGLGANGFAAHSPGGFNMTAAIIVEIVLTFLFVLTILMVTENKTLKEVAGVPIGLTLGLVNLVGIQVDNCSVNPARSFGPALIAGGWAIDQLWLFIVMPIIGAIIAAVLYRAIRSPQSNSNTS